jgi:exopolysaccharide biosynthesis protein
MKRFFKKPFRWAAVYSLALIIFTVFVLLDTFVIPRVGAAVESTPNTAKGSAGAAAVKSTAENITGASADITDTSYADENIKIAIETVYQYDTKIYIADIQLSDVSYLKTAFAKGTYGRNIKETTSNMAKDNNAIFAVNGDYYGFRDYGFVLRNGILYRETPGNSDALAVSSTGDFSIVNEKGTDARSLADSGAWQILSFGPVLIEGGNIVVTGNSEVSKAMKSNPRTAIGQISSLHYLMVVSDGRTQDSAGLSLLELAQLMADRGCTAAYNLDGGGSSTMWFNGKVVNNPTDGKSSGERSVSDIVYIGY